MLTRNFDAGVKHSSNANGQPARSAWNSTTADTFFSSPINNGYQSASSVGIARTAAEYVKDKVIVGVVLQQRAGNTRQSIDVRLQ